MSAPLCALCGSRMATYVCQGCGKAVCGSCFEPAHWHCTECLAKTVPVSPTGFGTVSSFSIATWIFFIAFALIFIGILLMTLGSISNLQGVSGGAVILIGPIPIVLGTGPYSVPLIVLAVVLSVFALAFYFMMRRRS